MGSTLNPHPELFGDVAPAAARSGKRSAGCSGPPTPSCSSARTSSRELDALVDDVLAGRGRLVLLEGAPGIGKTRLLDAARARAGERDLVVLRGARLRARPRLPVRRRAPALRAAARSDRRRAAPRCSTAPPAWRRRCSGRRAPRPPPRTPTRRPPHFHALYWLTANLAERGAARCSRSTTSTGPTPARCASSQFLLPRLEELPVLRRRSRPGRAEPAPTGGVDALATDPGGSSCAPRRSATRAVRALVARELGDAPDPAFARRVPARRPAATRSCCASCSASSRPRASRRARRRVPLVGQLAPPTVARAVLLRLARLGEDAPALARAVAVLGDGGAAAPRRRAGRARRRARRRAAAALARADILAPARPLAFAHPILRAAVYADLDAGERAARAPPRRRAARRRGRRADAIAVHLLATEPARRPGRSSRRCARPRRQAARARRGRHRGRLPAARARRAAGGRRARAACCSTSPPPRCRPAIPTRPRRTSTRACGSPRPALARGVRAASARVALLAAGRRDEAFALLERAVDGGRRAPTPSSRCRSRPASIGIARLDRSRLPWAARAAGRATAAGSTGATAGERDAARHAGAPRRVLAPQRRVGGGPGRRRRARARRRAAARGRRRAVAAASASRSTCCCWPTASSPARRALDRGSTTRAGAGRRRAFAFASGCAAGCSPARATCARPRRTGAAAPSCRCTRAGSSRCRTCSAR